MGKTTSFCRCNVRPVLLLVAIIVVCVCSLVLSGYYIHNEKLSLTPREVMRMGRGWGKWPEPRGPADDEKEGGDGTGSHPPASNSDVTMVRNSIAISEALGFGETSKVESLNNIDIPLFIENNLKASNRTQKSVIPNPPKSLGASRVQLAVDGVKTGVQPEVGDVHTGVQPEVGGVKTGVQPAVGGVQTNVQQASGGVQTNVQQASGGVQTVVQPEVGGVQTNVQPASAGVQQTDVWPVREKVQMKTHKIYQSSNPLYEKPVRTRTNWHGERYIVYLCHSHLPCAGWGDRQHGIFSAYLLSLVTNRTFKVDFTNPCPLHRLFHPRISNWKIEPDEFKGLSSTHLYALNDRNFRDATREMDFNALYPQDVVYLTTNYDYYYTLKGNPLYTDLFHKRVRNRPRPVLFADLWQGIFKMNRRVLRRFTPALKEAKVTKDHKLVCAHIRFGRNPTIPYDNEVRNTPDSIKPFWEFVDRYSDPAKYRLFVASDWEGFRQKVNKVYKDIAIDVKGQVIHIDQIQTQLARQGNQSAAMEVSEGLCDGLEKVVADQYVLSQCDILLLTYSVFGKAAAYLRRSNQDLYLMDKGKIQSLKLFDDKVRHKYR